MCQLKLRKRENIKMSKFKVTATLLTTRTITKVIEANGLDEATKKLLDESKNSK
jgi:hypothetical protein